MLKFINLEKCITFIKIFSFELSCSSKIYKSIPTGERPICGSKDSLHRIVLPNSK